MKTSTLSLISIISISFLSGCAGDTFSTAEEANGSGSNMRDGSGGEGAETFMDKTGGSNGESGGSSSTGGTDTGTGGNGGDTSTGGSDNTGGSENTGGSGGGETCVPKTCDTLTVILSGDAIQQGEPGSSCGTHEDGCGNFIFCDECNGDNRECGGRQTQKLTAGTAGNPMYTEGVAGVCGGGCTEQTVNSIKSWYCPDHDKAYSCSLLIEEPQIVPPPSDFDGMTCTISEYGDAMFCCNL